MTDLNALRLFAVIARHRSFRRAATELGLSPSTLSDRMQQLEVQLGMRLLNRTTRSVAPTEAGQVLLAQITPALAGIDHAIATTGAARAVPVGTLRINGPRPAVDFVLAPKIAAFLAINPGMRAEIVASDGFIDIVAEGFDAGVRYGESLEQDMIAVSLGGTQRFLVVGSPRYLVECGRPEHPDELASHRRLAHRFKTGNMPDWEFEKDGHVIRMAPNGPVTTNDPAVLVAAVRAGLGLAYMFSEHVAAHLEEGALHAVLMDWTPPFEGPFLYFPHRQLMPPGLRAFVDFLKTTAAPS